MIKITSISTFIILLLQAIYLPVIAQEKTLPDVEKVALFTDRSVYIAGESICFSAFIMQPSAKQPMSLILYAELMANDGKSLSRGKFSAIDYASNGCLEIPSDIITGVYFIRAYTKYMRNAGVNAYAYKAIRIVNPYRNEVVTGDKVIHFNKIPGLENYYSTIEIDSLNSEEKTAENELVRKLPDITTNKALYSPGDQVTISLNQQSPSEVARLCLSVVPTVAASNASPELTEPERSVSTLIFHPETRGLTISGVMRDASDDKLISNKIVNLSIIGGGRDFIPVTTDNDGKYLFALPHLNGYRDLYLGTSGSAGNRFKLLVDNDFCGLPVELPNARFTLTEEEREIVYNMALNATITKSFQEVETKHNYIDEEESRAFYGTPVHTLLLNDYVQLPNLEEYFNELPGMIKVRKKGGKKYFKVIGTQLEMVTNDPLVMIDLVAVDDPEKVLAAPPASVARIEMINEPYQKGNVVYGGLISIISKRGDFAGVDLPASGFFINFLFLSDTVSGKTNAIAADTLPDARNTVYRIPEIIPDWENTSFSFTAPATPGKYAIVLNGVMNDGTLTSKAGSFEVKR